MPDPFLVRLAEPSDAAQVMAIYNYEVQHTTATFDLVPRTLAEQRAWLADRSGAFTVIVAEQAGALAGFASLTPYKDRAAYRTTVEDSVYVRGGSRGLGVGTALLTRLLEVADTSGFHAVMARVEASGMASRALHHACGFELVGVEREVGRKFNRWLDVALMQCVLHERRGARPDGVGRAGFEPT